MVNKFLCRRKPYVFNFSDKYCFYLWQVVRPINGNCVLHFDHGPALRNFIGCGYYVNGELHRENGPAWIGHDGTEYYYLYNNPVTK